MFQHKFQKKERPSINPLVAIIQVHINIPLFQISDNHIPPYEGNKFVKQKRNSFVTSYSETYLLTYSMVQSPS